MRARGWRSNFPLGNTTAGPGIPLISGFKWDTGLQVRWKAGAVEAIGALTNGTLSSPRLSDDNSGKQISGRVAVTPVVGLIIGASAARGAWLSRQVPVGGAAPAQSALGGDVEYSRDHWILRGEMVFSRWSLPRALSPSDTRSLTALATWAEGRYRLTPRIYTAGRVDRLGFSRLLGSAGLPVAWDAPLTRVEGGFGFYLQRNLVLRTMVQGNRRDGGRVQNRTFFSAQLAYWF
jgi:hypothetical protein